MSFPLNPFSTGSTAVCPDPNPLPNDPGQNYRLCMGGEAVCEREVGDLYMCHVNLSMFYLAAMHWDILCGIRSA